MNIGLHGLLVLVGFFNLNHVQFVESNEEGLYKPGDNVTLLDGDNLISTLSNSSTLWMVEYYSSWCGHCQEFAPTIKALAKDISGWRWLFNIAAINCGNTAPSGEENFLTCHRDPLWVLDYPEFRFYSTSFNGTTMGETYEGSQELKTLRKSIVDYVYTNIDGVKWDYDNIKPIMLPTTYDEFLSYSTPAFWKTLPYKILYAALVFEDENSYMGREIILDTSSCTNMFVRRVNTENENGKLIMAVLNIKENELPMVIVMNNNGTNFPIKVVMKTRSFYTYQLTQLPGVGQPSAKIQISDTLTRSGDNQTSLVNYKEADRNVVYLADIESALHYSLSIEVSSVRILEGKKLEALKTFLKVFPEIGDYFPGRKSTINFLISLYYWVKDQKSIRFDVWSKRVNEKSIDSFLPPTNKLWVGCQSSKPSLRGYPCSLWTLFHTLTVAASNAGISDESLVPDAMYAYITNFFGCRDCRKNFKKEVSEFSFEDTSEVNDAVLWLWKVHNSVNKRLHLNSTTEDPEFPKVQFPPKEMCPSCTDPITGEINEDELISFLMHRYSKQNINLDYLDLNFSDFYNDAAVNVERTGEKNDSKIQIFDLKEIKPQPIDYELKSEIENGNTTFFAIEKNLNSNNESKIVSEFKEIPMDLNPKVKSVYESENDSDKVSTSIINDSDKIKKLPFKNYVNEMNFDKVLPTQMERPPLAESIKIEFDEPSIHFAFENRKPIIPKQSEISSLEKPITVEILEDSDYGIQLQVPQPNIDQDLSEINPNAFFGNKNNDAINLFMAEQFSEEIRNQVNDILNDVVIIPEEVIVKMDKEIEIGINHGGSDSKSIKEKLENSFHFEQQRFHPRALGGNKIIGANKDGYNRSWGLDFSPLDMSLCVMLWLTTIVGSVFLYSVFRMRRMYSKKKDYRRMM